MLIINDEQRLRAGGFSMGELCKYCSKEFAAYPLIMSDMERLGKLAYNEQSSTASAERLAGFKTFFELLREHDLMCSDLSLRAQVYMMSAIFMGFFLVAPLTSSEFMLSDEELAELMAETVIARLSLGTLSHLVHCKPFLTLLCNTESSYSSGTRTVSARISIGLGPFGTSRRLRR